MWQTRRRRWPEAILGVAAHTLLMSAEWSSVAQPLATPGAGEPGIILQPLY
jgi:hypothetical protein